MNCGPLSYNPDALLFRNGLFLASWVRSRFPCFCQSKHRCLHAAQHSVTRMPAYMAIESSLIVIAAATLLLFLVLQKEGGVYWYSKVFKSKSWIVQRRMGRGLPPPLSFDSQRAWQFCIEFSWLIFKFSPKKSSHKLLFNHLSS